VLTTWVYAAEKAHRLRQEFDRTKKELYVTTNTVHPTKFITYIPSRSCELLAHCPIVTTPSQRFMGVRW